MTTQQVFAQQTTPTSTSAVATPVATTAQAEDRSNLLKDAAALAVEVAHGIHRLNDQQLSNILGSLVRTKLLSADDSYRLRDRLLDTEAFEKALVDRIEASLKRKGIATDRTLEQIRSRLQVIEARAS